MKSKPDLTRLTGILCLVLIVVSIIWYLTEFPVTNDPQKIGTDLQNIANNPARYLGFMGADVIYNLAVFALGGFFYLIFRPYGQHLAIFGLLGFVAAGIIWMIVDIPSFALYPLAKEYVSASGTTANTIADGASLLSLWGHYSKPIILTFYGIGLMAFGLLIALRGVVPRPLGWLAMLAGVVMLISWYNFFESSLISDVAYYIAEFWYLPVGFWLLIRGTREVTTTESV